MYTEIEVMWLGKGFIASIKADNGQKTKWIRRIMLYLDEVWKVVSLN